MDEDDLDRMRVERCLSGDGGAFEEILDRYGKPVYNAILRMGTGHDAARDVSQQVFLKVYERLDTYDPAHRFFSWLYRVAINETINHLKAQRTFEQLSDTFASGHATPEEEAANAEEKIVIQNALLAIDIKYRLAIIVRHFLDLSYDEAALVLSVPVKTVKSRLFTARQLLREILEEQRHAAG